MKRLLILCNALDDRTRRERGIATDSPAATRKMVMTAHALRRARVVVTVISLGRGRDTGNPRWHAATARRSAGTATVYLAFVDRPIVSQLVSLAGAAGAVWSRSRRARPTLLVYNRSLAYVPALVVARLRGLPVVLDLEDGYTGSGARLRERLVRLGNRLFDSLCGGRALLACSALAAATVRRPTMVYYGISDEPHRERGLPGRTVTALLGGSIAPDTGGDLLAEAIAELRRSAPVWADQLGIEITGRGPSVATLAALAAARGHPRVRVLGRMSDADYEALRRRVDVGLALKPNAGPLAHTTFPSKVIEMAAAGQLVITTDISDVRAVLGDDGAVYLTDDTAATLVAALRWVVEHREEARATAARGTAAVARACDATQAGPRLAAFLFPERP